MNMCMQCGKVYAVWEKLSPVQDLYTCPNGHQWVVVHAP